MKLHCFVCATLLFPSDRIRDEEFHLNYLRPLLETVPEEGVELTVIQNGCEFPTLGAGLIRHPFPKNVAYNWLVCDANCNGDYWLFLPEDCRILPRGWAEITKHMEKKKKCFALSKDPKALVCERGIFRELPEEVVTVCDMNFLGKEIACVILRGELEQRGFHCITKNWRPISAGGARWGNELYEGINVSDQPEVNRTLGLPIFQDYGFDGWKASRDELEEVFMKIITKSLEGQRRHAESLKDLVAHYGPLISEVPYEGIFYKLKERIRRA